MVDQGLWSHLLGMMIWQHAARYVVHDDVSRRRGVRKVLGAVRAAGEGLQQFGRHGAPAYDKQLALRKPAGPQVTVLPGFRTDMGSHHVRASMNRDVQARCAS